jgi:DNA-binding NarL/FixJ family response regulator
VRPRPRRAFHPSLSISAATAKAHVARLLAKLGARDRVQLVIAAYEAGLVPP